VVVGPTVGLSFALVGDSLRVGRDPASATLLLRDQTVSRNHASLDRRGNEWLVTDQGSTNGTFVNGQRLAPQQPVPLQPGARVKFGDVECMFQVT
jgi:pSer/pThr/pTyr-binding forkhead associated (FHA) protein